MDWMMWRLAFAWRMLSKGFVDEHVNISENRMGIRVLMVPGSVRVQNGIPKRRRHQFRDLYCLLNAKFHPRFFKPPLASYMSPC